MANINKRGLVNGRQLKRKVSTLEELWGYNPATDFGTLNEDEFKISLKELNMADLQAKCIHHGVLPTDDRKRTIDRLLKAFNDHRRKYNTPVPPTTNKISQEKAKRILEIMRDAR